MYAGVREGKERENLDRFIAGSDVIAVDHQIAEIGGLLLRQYGKSHGTGFADAIIAATAQVERAILVTLNSKHFPMVTDLFVPYQKA
jgi:predicted nucleic acid-binding protein